MEWNLGSEWRVESYESGGMGSGFRFRVRGSGFRVQDSGFRVQGSGFRFRVQGSGFGVHSSWLIVQGLGFRVHRVQYFEPRSRFVSGVGTLTTGGKLSVNLNGFFSSSLMRV